MVVGGFIGYVLGARAGRGRYDQIKRWAASLRSHPAYLQLRNQASGVSDLVRTGVAQGLRTGSRQLREAADDSVVSITEVRR
jgi:hypothetical protein